MPATTPPVKPTDNIPVVTFKNVDATFLDICPTVSITIPTMKFITETGKDIRIEKIMYRGSAIA